VSMFSGLLRGLPSGRFARGVVREVTNSGTERGGVRMLPQCGVTPRSVSVVRNAVCSGVCGVEGRLGRMKWTCGWRYCTRVWDAALVKFEARVVSGRDVVASCGEEEEEEEEREPEFSSQPALASSKRSRRGVRRETLILDRVLKKIHMGTGAHNRTTAVRSGLLHPR
jgi:hypothetical protein